MDEWVITADNIFLVDVGSPGYTAYEVDKGGFKAPDIVKMFEAFPGLEDGTLKNHHIHTHHGMSAFFSGTDESQLNDRSQVANYFLMLIVNFSGAWVARVAFVGKTKQLQKSHIIEHLELGEKTIAFSNNEDGYDELLVEDGNVVDTDDTKEEIKEKEYLFTMECNIVKEDYTGHAADPFYERIREVEQALAPQTTPTYGQSYTGHTARVNQPTGGAVSSSTYRNTEARREKEERKMDDVRGQKRKGTMEMTDKEWMKENGWGEDVDSRLTAEEYRFDERHARAFLNAESSSIQQSIKSATLDYRDPISNLMNYYRSLTGTLLRSFKEDITDDISEWLDGNFPGTTEEEQLGFLNALAKYLKGFDFYEVVKVLQPQIAAAQDYLEEEITYAQHGRRDPRAGSGNQHSPIY